jgi:hypothetical protein
LHAVPTSSKEINNFRFESIALSEVLLQLTGIELKMQHGA